MACSEFTDSECLDLAQLIGLGDFRKLGHQLQYVEPVLERYERTGNLEGHGMGTYKMLTDWKKGVLDHEQRAVLSSALNGAGLVSLAQQVRYGKSILFRW